MTSFIQVARKIGAAPIVFRILVGASILCAQANLAALCVAQPTPTVYPVEGVVENSLTHEPIARALVESSTDAILSGGDGRFELHLPAGVAQITVRRPGYEGGAFAVQETMHIVKVGANMSPLSFSLTPSASITGHVTLSSGDVADGLRFELYRKSVADGHARWIQQESVTTSSDGIFRLPSLRAPALYVLCSSPSPDRVGSAVSSAPVSGYPGACYPGGGDLASAISAPLKLAPGQQAQVEISLLRQTFYPVTISLANGAGQPGAPQIFDRSGRPTTFAMRTDRNGAYETPLPNGSYYAEIHTWGRTQLYARRDFTVAGAPLSNLTLVPAPLRRITVEVRTEFTANPDRGPGSKIFSLHDRASEPPINLNLISADRQLVDSFGVNLQPVDNSSDNGLYEADISTQGAYWIEASRYDAYVSSMTSGATDLLREPLMIGASSAASPIEITLRNDMGQLELSATNQTNGNSANSSNAEDLSPVFFYCIPLSPNQRRIYQSAIQSPFQESAQFPLPPGNYLVVAFARDHEIDLDDPNQMSWLTAHGQTITIQPSATTKVQMDPIPDGDQEASQ